MGNMRCQDDDGDGIWKCDCLEGFHIPNNDKKCVLDACTFVTSNPHGRHPQVEHDGGEYRTVSGKCYYFENSNMDFVTAAANCKSKFNGNGRLFEPRDIETHELVAGEALVIKTEINSNELFWIGVRAQPHSTSRKFYYLSSHLTEIIDGWAFAEPNDLGGNEDCVSVLEFNELGWGDVE